MRLDIKWECEYLMWNRERKKAWRRKERERKNNKDEEESVKKGSIERGKSVTELQERWE